jgi:transposase InsO family protein
MCAAAAGVFTFYFVVRITCDWRPRLPGPTAGLALDRRTYDHRIEHRFITSGKLIPNACIKGFNGKLRDEHITERELLHLKNLRNLLESVRKDCNHHRAAHLAARDPARRVVALVVEL